MDNKQSTEEQRRLRDLTTTSFWLLMAVGSGMLLVLLRFIAGAALTIYQHHELTFPGRAMTSLLWATGWFSVAFVFGFLFGIPKVLQANQRTAEDDSAVSNSAGPGTNSAPGGARTDSRTPYPLKVNTNLEEISDWLTKILVGATLTQLTKVPGMVKSAAGYMSMGMGDSGSETFAAAVLMYFSAVGFFAGYVLTRMFFSLAFARADTGSTFPEIGRLDIGHLAETSIALGSTIQPRKEVREVVQQLEGVQITDSLTAPQAIAVAKAANITGNAKRALQAARLAVQKSPRDPEAHLNLAIALHSAGGDDIDVMQEFEQAQSLISDDYDPHTSEDIYNSIVYLALYLKSPLGFDKAISYGEQFVQRKAPGDASIWINLACAYGQKFGYYKALTNPPDKVAVHLADARDRALNCIQNALRLEPSSIARIRELYHGSGPDPSDNDLKPFEGDETFERTLA